MEKVRLSLQSMLRSSEHFLQEDKVSPKSVPTPGWYLLKRFYFSCNLENRFKFAFFISFFTDFSYSKTPRQTWLTLCAPCATRLMARCLSVICAHPVKHLTIRKNFGTALKTTAKISMELKNFFGR